MRWYAHSAWKNRCPDARVTAWKPFPGHGAIVNTAFLGGIGGQGMAPWTAVYDKRVGAAWILRVHTKWRIASLSIARPCSASCPGSDEAGSCWCSISSILCTCMYGLHPCLCFLVCAHMHRRQRVISNIVFYCLPPFYFLLSQGLSLILEL